MRKWQLVSSERPDPPPQLHTNRLSLLASFQLWIHYAFSCVGPLSPMCSKSELGIIARSRLGICNKRIGWFGGGERSGWLAYACWLQAGHQYRQALFMTRPIPILQECGLTIQIPTSTVKVSLFPIFWGVCSLKWLFSSQTSDLNVGFPRTHTLLCSIFSQTSHLNVVFSMPNTMLCF